MNETRQRGNAHEDLVDCIKEQMKRHPQLTSSNKLRRKTKGQLDLLWICCTPNPQQIEAMEIGLYPCRFFWKVTVCVQGVPKKTAPLFYFCDNFRKWTPILTIFSPLEPEIYDA